jgi:hypothetical protein
MAFLSAAAPVPPLAFFRGEQRVASLGYGGLEGVEAADVDALAGDAAKFFVHFSGILAGELADGADFQQLEIAEHGGAHGNQILQTAGWSVGHKNLLDKDKLVRYRELV